MPSPKFSDHTFIQLKKAINEHKLPKDFLNAIKQWLLPIAESIFLLHQTKNKPLIISFNGAQGSGKSTLTHFIALVLKYHFKITSINISLDDFYFTKQQRLQRSKTIHPLLKTRGVPGTHDIDLAKSVLNQLKNCSLKNPCFVPLFDKAIDERANKDSWLKVESPVDVILFEGWCNHAPYQSNDQLKAPINTLEQEEDAEGIWRSYVNEQLKHYQQQLFLMCDYLYFIKIPSFKKVYEWRGLQEQKLSNNDSKKEIMDNAELIRFIQHYERITRLCLEELPKVANTVIELNDDHQITSVIHL